MRAIAPLFLMPFVCVGFIVGLPLLAIFGGMVAAAEFLADL